MNKLKHLAKHTIDQALHPDTDKECWMAYQVLKVRYPSLTYQSHNGYHCDGLVDYVKGVQWNYDKLLDTKTDEVLLTTDEPFHSMKTEEIVNTWMRVVGETATTKKSWLRKLFR